jgi:hypothetical protein
MANTLTNADANSDTKQQANINVEQAMNLLAQLTADIDFKRQVNGKIKQNAEQGFASISEQTTADGTKQFVIYNGHLANSTFLTSLNIHLNSDEEQAIADGIKHRSDSNNKHNISQRANSVLEQLDDAVLEQLSVKRI